MKRVVDRLKEKQPVDTQPYPGSVSAVIEGEQFASEERALLNLERQFAKISRLVESTAWEAWRQMLVAEEMVLQRRLDGLEADKVYERTLLCGQLKQHRRIMTLAEASLKTYKQIQEARRAAEAPNEPA